MTHLVAGVYFRCGCHKTYSYELNISTHTLISSGLPVNFP